MTYEESYRRCKTLTELEDMVKNDIATAMMLNPDRVLVIKTACEKVANENFNIVPGSTNINLKRFLYKSKNKIEKE